MTEAEVRKDLIALITDKVGINAEEVMPDADIENDLGCTGDDFFELMEAYAKHFNVDMSGFLWYFHTHDESMATLNPLPGHPASTQVDRIPVTFNILVEKAMLGKWDMTYPPHALQPTYTRSEKVVHWLFLAILTYFISRSCL
jgi:hypothetical protein